MGRQAFRKRKSDGTVDDGTGGGGVQNWWTYDSENTLLLTGDNKWNAAIQTPFTIPDGMTTRTLTSIYNPNLHHFIATKTGDLTKMTVYVNQTTSSGSCTLHVGIYESDDGYMGDLIGVAVYPNSIKSTTGAYSQTSFQASSTSTTSQTITLTKGKMYYYGCLLKSSSNTAGDVGDGIKLRAKSSSKSTSAHGKVTNYNNDSYNAYQTHTWGGLATTESGWAWVQQSSRDRPYLILEY
tara:strand:- start:1021 stop:1734 length:714 start_codon:yes stop_codon:yes gene_type:complete